MEAEKGRKLKVEYRGTLKDGTEFDSSESHGAPLEFTYGEDRLIKGFEDALEGMKEGEEKEFTIPPTEAYGEMNPQLVQEFSKNQIPEGTAVEIGMTLGMQLPDGRQIPGTVTDVGEENITIDLNHPLAGKELTFWIKVIEIA
ncbi:MAG TPA: peptidylprolyl isomerase [Euryarchaeota archaeon]|nr:peptidylprolyl isomerase [Euryarchaeota archaeon]